MPGVYDKIPNVYRISGPKINEIELQIGIIRFVFPGFPLLLRLPGGNKVLKIKIIKTLFYDI